MTTKTVVAPACREVPSAACSTSGRFAIGISWRGAIVFGAAARGNRRARGSRRARSSRLMNGRRCPPLSGRCVLFSARFTFPGQPGKAEWPFGSCPFFGYRRMGGNPGRRGSCVSRPGRQDEWHADLGRHRRGRLPRLASLRLALVEGPPRDLRRQPRHRLARRTSSTSATARLHLRQPRRHRSTSRSRSRSTSSTTSRARRARSTTCACRCTRSRSAPTGRTTRSASRSSSARASCSPRRARSTATRRYTRSRRPTGATSTRSARAASTTRPSATPRR